MGIGELIRQARPTRVAHLALRSRVELESRNYKNLRSLCVGGSETTELIFQLPQTVQTCWLRIENLRGSGFTSSGGPETPIAGSGVRLVEDEKRGRARPVLEGQLPRIFSWISYMTPNNHLNPPLDCRSSLHFPYTRHYPKAKPDYEDTTTPTTQLRLNKPEAIAKYSPGGGGHVQPPSTRLNTSKPSPSYANPEFEDTSAQTIAPMSKASGIITSSPSRGVESPTPMLEC